MKQGDDLLTTWTKAQQKLWESLAAALSNSRQDDGKELVKAAQRGGLAAWEAAVQQSLKAQEIWLEQWCKQTQLANPELTRASDELRGIMQSWISTQTQMWENWFSLLRNYSSSMPQPEDALETLMPIPQAPASHTDTSATPADFPSAETTTSSASPTPTPTKDDLKVLKGIGKVLEDKLNALGISTYQQIALLSPEDTKRIEAELRFPGRIQRDNWIQQAREAHRRQYGADPA